jgi:hypothetical protein
MEIAPGRRTNPSRTDVSGGPRNTSMISASLKPFTSFSPSCQRRVFNRAQQDGKARCCMCIQRKWTRPSGAHRRFALSPRLDLLSGLARFPQKPNLQERPAQRRGRSSSKFPIISVLGNAKSGAHIAALTFCTVRKPPSSSRSTPRPGTTGMAVQVSTTARTAARAVVWTDRKTRRQACALSPVSV